MKVFTPYGEMPYEAFVFPDGQQHVKLKMRETRSDYLTATIETAIKDADDLFKLLLLKDTLTASGYRVALDIRYLLGGRMDRRISFSEPFTLEVVARVLMGAGFTKIRILDPHSEASLRLLGATAVYPKTVLENVLQETQPDVVIAPDKGATGRVAHLIGERYMTVQGHKHRDPNTGALSGFSVESHSVLKDKHCLILDDICDGGGTFTGLGKALKDAGANRVSLFVTHGIFSKGLPLANIDKVYTTDSYIDVKRPFSTTVYPISMRDC